MKKHIKPFFFYFLLILFGAIPFILLFFQDLIKHCFNIGNDKFVDVFLVMIPFSFSSITVVLNFMSEYNKNQKDKLKSIKDKLKYSIDETNSIINEYNKIMLKTEINYNNIMNMAFTMIGNLERLKEKPIFNTIITQWENNIKIVYDFTNDVNFRNFLRYNITEVVKIYNSNNSYDIELEYLGGLTTNFHKYAIIDLDEMEFLYRLRNIINFTKEEKNIIQTYLGMYSNGDIYNLACNEYIDAINEYKNCYESEIRNRKIDDKKLFTLLYRLNIYILYLCGNLTSEAYLINYFMNIIVEKVNKYYENQNKKYMKLNEIIKFDIINEPNFLNKYIDKESFYKFHNILENTNGS